MSDSNGTDVNGHIYQTNLNTDGVVIALAGGVLSSTAVGTAGQVLTSNGAGVAPTFQPGGGTGTVTSVSVISANGFAGTVANATTTPAITLTTSQTGVLSGNGTAVSGSAVTQFDVLVGGASNAISSIGPGSAGQVLQSAGNAANPAYSTATYPVTAGTSGNVITSNGTNFTSSALPTGSTAILVTTYNVSDSPATWNKNANTKYIAVFGWAGGGGGGSGRKGSSTAAGGGGGGGSGGFFYLHGPSTFFNNSESVVIGAGGGGGGAQSSDANNGINGSPGNLSSFGNMVAPPGNFGLGGTTTSASFGQGTNPEYGVGTTTSAVVGRGGNGTNTAGSIGVGYGTPSSYFTATGGGGGGGADTGTARAGGAGGQITNFSGTVIMAGAAGGLEGGTINGSLGTAQRTTGGLIGGAGGGGGGGGYSVGAGGATAGGTGGNGNVPGGGGGGGGGGISTVANSGAGGDGGNGRVIVIEYF